MNTQGWIVPGSEADMALHGLKSACEKVIDPKHRESFIAEAQLSEEIRKVREITTELLGVLAHIEREAEIRTNIEALAERLGGFA